MTIACDDFALNLVDALDRVESGDPTLGEFELADIAAAASKRAIAAEYNLAILLRAMRGRYFDPNGAVASAEQHLRLAGYEE